MNIIDAIKGFKLIDISKNMVSINGVNLVGNFVGDTCNLISEIKIKIDETSSKNVYSYIKISMIHNQCKKSLNFTNILFIGENVCIHKKDYCEVFSLDELRNEDISYLVLKYGKVFLEEGFINCS